MDLAIDSMVSFHSYVNFFPEGIPLADSLVSQTVASLPQSSRLGAPESISSFFSRVLMLFKKYP
jgi:hypothetical protein